MLLLVLIGVRVLILSRQACSIKRYTPDGEVYSWPIIHCIGHAPPLPESMWGRYTVVRWNATHDPYILLYLYGGMYVDRHLQLLRDPAPFLSRDQPTTIEAVDGFLASPPGHPLLLSRRIQAALPCAVVVQDDKTPNYYEELLYFTGLRLYCGQKCKEI